MSYQTLQDAIHRAMIYDPPEPPHDPPLQVCRTCYGADHCCPVCHGAGWWKGDEPAERESDGDPCLNGTCPSCWGDES